MQPPDLVHGLGLRVAQGKEGMPLVGRGQRLEGKIGAHPIRRVPGHGMEEAGRSDGRRRNGDPGGHRGEDEGAPAVRDEFVGAVGTRDDHGPSVGYGDPRSSGASYRDAAGDVHRAGLDPADVKRAVGIGGKGCRGKERGGSGHGSAAQKRPAADLGSGHGTRVCVMREYRGPG